MKNLQIKRFYLPKAGNKQKEYEDAFAYKLCKETNRLVVADGASHGFESRAWANSLVSNFKKELPAFDKGGFEEWLKKPVKAWRGTIDWEKLPWYAEEKARRGAFSTLLGIDFGSKPYEKWQAVAVGDSCLFQIREEKIIVRFPIESSGDFDSTPDLISTRNDYNAMSLDNIRVCNGDCRPNDRFILATDAFSAWFLRGLEAKKEPWKVFFELAGNELPGNIKHKSFKQLINHFRKNREMENDDVTVLLAEHKE